MIIPIQIITEINSIKKASEHNVIRRLTHALLVHRFRLPVPVAAGEGWTISGSSGSPFISTNISVLSGASSNGSSFTNIPVSGKTPGTWEIVGYGKNTPFGTKAKGNEWWTAPYRRLSPVSQILFLRVPAGAVPAHPPGRRPSFVPRSVRDGTPMPSVLTQSKNWPKSLRSSYEGYRRV